MKAFPRDIDVVSLMVRHIGIESELQVGEDDYTVPDHLHMEITRHGLLQSVGWDGGGREFRTNPISCKSLKQVRGHKYLSEYFNNLKSETRVSDYGGTHIHISILEKDHKNLEANVVALATAFFPQFQKIAGRRTHWADRLSDLETIYDVHRWLEGRRAKDGSRTYYAKGSMLAPTSHQTFEFRGPRGSNDAQEIFAWVEFLENVVKRANRKSVHGMKFADLIKGERIEAYVAGLEGWRELTADDLNATINVTALLES